jgi:hypothetical protein|tara:strand:- start:210 stop:479 length:270 start_codon:yes stop_codon:yes gene_type:complete
MKVNLWAVRDTLGQPSKFSQREACALALEFFESLSSIASEIEDAETLASEEQGDRGRVIVYQSEIEMMKEHIERADTIMARVLASRGGE